MKSLRAALNCELETGFPGDCCLSAGNRDKSSALIDSDSDNGLVKPLLGKPPHSRPIVENPQSKSECIDLPIQIPWRR